MKGPWGVARVPSSPGLRGSAAQGWLAARKVAAGSTPERQLLVCWLSLEGTLTVTWNKFGLSLVSLSPPLSAATHSRGRTVSASDARSSLRSVTPTTLALPSASSLIAFRAGSALNSWRLQRLASRTESAHPPACRIQQDQIRRRRPCRVLHPMWPQWSSSHACDAKRTAVRTESTHVRNGGEQAPARWRPLSARDEALQQWCTLKTISQTHG